MAAVKLTYDESKKCFKKMVRGQWFRSPRGLPNNGEGRRVAERLFLAWLQGNENKLPPEAKYAIEIREKMIEYHQLFDPFPNEVDAIREQIEKIKKLVKEGANLQEHLWWFNPLKAVSPESAMIWTDRLSAMDHLQRQGETAANFCAAWASFTQFKQTKTTPDGLAVLKSHWNKIKDQIEFVALKDFQSSHFEKLHRFVHGLNRSLKHKANLLSTFRQLCLWLEATERIPKLPSAIKSPMFAIKVPSKRHAIFTRNEIQAILKSSNDEERLFVFLACNCAMTQSEIAKLEIKEVDLKNKTITRRRSKHQHQTSDAIPFVIYHLWAETAELLKRYMQKKGQPALTREGKALVRSGRVDLIGPPFSRQLEMLGIEGKSFKSFRKTGTSILGSSQWRGFRELYLGNSGDTTTDRYYDQTFELPLEVTDFIRKELGIGDGRAKP